MPHDPAPGQAPGGAPRTSHGTGDLRHALLASLGLPADATPEAVEAAHERVAAYLTSAPTELSAWAQQQAAAADAAHAVLTGRAGDVLSRQAAASSPAGAGAGARPVTATGPASPWPKIALVLGSLALIAAIVVGVARLGPGQRDADQQAKPPVAMTEQGGQGGQADAQGGQGGAAASPTPTPVDPAKVKELEAKVAKDPKDALSMARLGDIYFEANEFAKAAQWRERVAALQPNDTDVMLTTGLAYFNAGRLTKAEQWWTKCLQADPKKAEAYYDLGFLYVSKTPPDAARAKQMWDKVVELDKNGPLAQKVQNHMGALLTPAPTAPATSSSK